MKRWVVGLQYAGIGGYIGVCIGLGVILGYYADRIIDSSPLLTFAGLFIGIFLAFWGTYQLLLPLLRQNKEKEGK